MRAPQVRYHFSDLPTFPPELVRAVTGRLQAQMMTGETPFAEVRPFAVERFG